MDHAHNQIVVDSRQGGKRDFGRRRLNVSPLKSMLLPSIR